MSPCVHKHIHTCNEATDLGVNGAFLQIVHHCVGDPGQMPHVASSHTTIWPEQIDMTLGETQRLPPIATNSCKDLKVTYWILSFPSQASRILWTRWQCWNNLRNKNIESISYLFRKRCHIAHSCRSTLLLHKYKQRHSHESPLGYEQSFQICLIVQKSGSRSTPVLVLHLDEAWLFPG